MTEPTSAQYEARRAEIRPDTPCAGCGKPLVDEFVSERPVMPGVSEVVLDPENGSFDGVLTSALRAFHHGCEDE